MHDIVIRHGEVVDGTGRIVTPGFVDIHTHLDAQLFWDPAATSSCWHGVTTVVLGNCGVIFAPVRPGQERYLAGMMNSVEDIPTDTIMAGLDWGWETYGDYLRALGRRPLGVNAGGMVGHSALRYYVMGERSLDQNESATAEDIKAMADVLAEAMDAGALGFSTSRSFMHTVPDGTPLPGTFALPDELAGIADVLAQRGKGVIEVVPRTGERDGPERQNSVAEMAWMEQVSRACGRPLTFAITQSDRRPGLWSWVMHETAAARGRGADLRPQTSARGSAILYGLASRTPYDGLPTWASLMSKPYIERTVALADQALRAQLATEAEQVVLSGPLAPKDPAKLYLMPPGEARYDVSPDNSLAAEAARRGTTPAGAFLEYLVDTNGQGMLYYPVLNQDMAAVGAMITSPDVVVGLGDAGAHVALTMDAGLPTYVLSHWVRDKRTGSRPATGRPPTPRSGTCRSPSGGTPPSRPASPARTWTPGRTDRTCVPSTATTTAASPGRSSRSRSPAATGRRSPSTSTSIHGGPARWRSSPRSSRCTPRSRASASPPATPPA
jgi:N-acyl-D-aspartate/D-glutamate deacylase